MNAVLRKILCVLIFLLFSGQAFSDQTTGDYRTITDIYLNKSWVNFYLTETCPLTKPYYQLNPDLVDVDRFYATLLAAFHTGTKVKITWDDTASTVSCQVTMIKEQN